MPRWLVGLGGSDHDFSAALLRDLDIRVAIEQERLSRRKHGYTPWFASPVEQAVDYCLKTEGLALADVEGFVASDLLPSRVRHEYREHRLQLFPHHLCHAASAYLMLPPGARAGVLVYDGFGSVRGPAAPDSLRSPRETFSFFLFGPEGYQRIGQTVGLGFNEIDDFPVGVTNSIGLLYELVTAHLGYDAMESGKTMGLSAYGVPRFVNRLRDFVRYGDDPDDCFRCATDDPELPGMLEEILLTGGGGFAVKADLAASVQALINKTLLHCERFFVDHAIDCLCLSGGCALNTVANSYLVDHSALGVPIVIPPHCGDAGLGLGALWLAQFEQTRRAPRLTFRGQPPAPALARPGRPYTADDRRRAVQDFYPRVVADASVRSADDLARVLAAGAVVGVFNGPSEIGPRALGGRSIVADPRSVSTRERINRRLKKREPFRPLAPMVLASRYDEYFCDPRQRDAYMLKVARVRPQCQLDAPAVVHVDGTARVQVVGEDDDAFLAALLRAFARETGVGLLINTSFNRRGEPLVESPHDAVDAFLGLGLDGLYLDGEFYRPVDSRKPSR